MCSNKSTTVTKTYEVTFPVRVTVSIKLKEGEELTEETIKECAMSCVVQSHETDSGLRKPVYDKEGNRIGTAINWASVYAECSEEECELN